MKIFSAAQVREIDAYTIEHEPISSIDLMERAASKLVKWFVTRFGVERHVYLFAGPGNNGGDALAMARMLAQRQYKVSCYLLTASGKLSEDCDKNLQRLEEMETVTLIKAKNSGEISLAEQPGIIIDGLFGSGLSRPLEGLYLETITLINSSGLDVISIDIPSGLFGEDNSMNNMDGIIRANYTLTFQFPFLSFLFPENERFTGDWTVLDIGLHPDIIEQLNASYVITERTLVSDMLPQRNRFAHKGTFGHALVIAGSYGMSGAAVLAGHSALRSGCGLVSLHVPSSSYSIIQTALPEAIASLDNSSEHFSMLPDLSTYTAIAVGPGIGKAKASVEALRSLFEAIREPLVIDADALNILGKHRELMGKIPAGSVLTPHPGEFDRLFGHCTTGWERFMKQKEASKELGVIIILKGAFTGISFHSGEYYFNTTGNPGMATGGSGDVLTGIIVSLMAQGLSPESAALAGVYIHGRAGDIARNRVGEDALIAGDIIKALGNAFKEVRRTPFLHEGRVGGVIQ